MSGEKGVQLFDCHLMAAKTFLVKIFFSIRYWFIAQERRNRIEPICEKSGWDVESLSLFRRRRRKNCSPLVGARFSSRRAVMHSRGQVDLFFCLCLTYGRICMIYKSVLVTWDSASEISSLLLPEPSLVDALPLFWAFCCCSKWFCHSFMSMMLLSAFCNSGTASCRSTISLGGIRRTHNLLPVRAATRVFALAQEWKCYYTEQNSLISVGRLSRARSFSLWVYKCWYHALCIMQKSNMREKGWNLKWIKLQQPRRTCVYVLTLAFTDWNLMRKCDN